MERILERFHAVAAQCDATVVVGSDFTDVGNPAEFAFNAQSPPTSAPRCC